MWRSVRCVRHRTASRRGAVLSVTACPRSVDFRGHTRRGRARCWRGERGGGSELDRWFSGVLGWLAARIALPNYPEPEPASCADRPPPVCSKASATTGRTTWARREHQLTRAAPTAISDPLGWIADLRQPMAERPGRADFRSPDEQNQLGSPSVAVFRKSTLIAPTDYPWWLVSIRV